MELLKQQIQAWIFCSEQSISLEEIASSLKLSFDWDVTDEELLAAIEEIKVQFSSDDFSFELVEISEGFQFLTKKQYYPTVSALIQHKAKKKLSVSQMETLAIIAYRQPISKSEIEHIRGVSCDYAVQKLLEKELIEISGKSDGPGRPVLYSTSRSFMDYFGIKSVKDLPQLKDLHVEENEIGTPADVLTDEGPSVFAHPEISHSEEPADSDDFPGKEELAESMEPSGSEDAEAAIYADTDVEAIETAELTEEFVEDYSAEDLPDRKSIFMENEASEIPEEEDQDKED